MVPACETPGAFHRQYIQRLFDHAYEAGVALGAGTNLTLRSPGAGDVIADRAVDGVGFQVMQCFRKLTRHVLRGIPQETCQPRGSFRSYPRQARKRVDQILDWRRQDHSLSIPADQKGSPPARGPSLSGARARNASKAPFIAASTRS